MSGGGLYRSWCFYCPKKIPFSVFVPLDGDVDLLRMEIEVRLSGETSNLLIWKLNDPIPVAPFRTLSERLQAASLVTEFSVALEEPTDKLSAYFHVDLIENHLYTTVEVLKDPERPYNFIELDSPDFMKPATEISCNPLIDALMALQVIPSQFPPAPSIPVPIVLNIPFILMEALKCFDKDLIQSAYAHSYKTSKVPVNGSSHTQVPRESVYDTELLRILCNWLPKGGWSVTGLKSPDGRHKYSDAVLQKPNKTIVLEFVATTDPKDLRAHIEKTPGYMGLLSADEGWVIHFTCEMDLLLLGKRHMS